VIACTFSIIIIIIIITGIAVIAALENFLEGKLWVGGVEESILYPPLHLTSGSDSRLLCSGRFFFTPGTYVRLKRITLEISNG
jgi:hypothetical protein